MSETIIMIHGMWAGAWCWEKFKDYFEKKDYQCIVQDLRYHDVNPEEPPDPRLGTVSLLDYVEDLEKEIRRFEQKPVIMGHSMGGLLAQILGSRNLAKALVLLSPAAPRGILALKPSVLKSFWSSLSQWGFWKKPIKQTFNESVYSVLNLMPYDEQKRIYQRFVNESGKAAAEIGFWIFDSKRASEVNESNITCPVLIVAGKEDRMTPVSVIRKVAEKYGAACTYEEFRNHAHWLIGEPGWEEIAGFCASWLKKVNNNK